MSVITEINLKAAIYTQAPMVNACDGSLHIIQSLGEPSEIIEKVAAIFSQAANSWNFAEISGPNYGYATLSMQPIAYRAVRISKNQITGAFFFEPVDVHEISSELNAQISSHPFFKGAMGKASLKAHFAFQLTQTHLNSFKALPKALGDESALAYESLASYKLNRPHVFCEVIGPEFKENPLILMDHILSGPSKATIKSCLDSDLLGQTHIILEFIEHRAAEIFHALNTKSFFEYEITKEADPFCTLRMEKVGFLINAYLLFVHEKPKVAHKIFDFQTRKFYKAVKFTHPEAFDEVQAAYRLNPMCSLFSEKYILTPSSGIKYYIFENAGWKKITDLLSYLSSIETVLKFKYVDKLFLEFMRAVCAMGAGGLRLPGLNLNDIYFLQNSSPSILPLKIFAKHVEHTLDFRKSLKELVAIAYNLFLRYALKGRVEFLLPEIVQDKHFITSVKSRVATLNAEAKALADSGALIAEGLNFVFFADSHARIGIFEELCDIIEKLDVIFADAAFSEPSFLKLADLKAPEEDDGALAPQVAALKKEYKRIYQLFSQLDLRYQTRYPVHK